jgi:hypothetical protein
LSFKPVDFGTVTYSDLGMTNSDSTLDEPIRAQLVSLFSAKKALLMNVRFFPGKDAQGPWPVPQTEVQFLVVEQDWNYLGRIIQQEPKDFCWLAPTLDSGIQHLGHRREKPPAYGGRSGAYIGCQVSSKYPRLHYGFSVQVMIAYGLFGLFSFGFGGWHQVAIEVPKRNLYVAYP